MPETLVLIDPREIALIRYHRMTPAQQAAERSRLQDVARESRLARLSPEKRAAVEKQRADALAAAAAEQARVAALPPKQREAEIALRQKAAAEAALERLDPTVVAAAQESVAAKIGG